MHVSMLFINSQSVSKYREAYDEEIGKSDHSNWELTEDTPLRNALELLNQELCDWPSYLVTSLWWSKGYQNRADGRRAGKYKEWSCKLFGEYVAEYEIVPVSSAVRGSCRIPTRSLILASSNILGVPSSVITATSG